MYLQLTRLLLFCCCLAVAFAFPAQAAPQGELSPYLTLGLKILDIHESDNWRPGIHWASDTVLQLLEADWATDCARDAAPHQKAKEEGGRHTPFKDTRRKRAPVTVAEVEAGIVQLLELGDALKKEPPPKDPTASQILDEINETLVICRQLYDQIQELPARQRGAACTSLKGGAGGAASASYS